MQKFEAEILLVIAYFSLTKKLKFCINQFFSAHLYKIEIAQLDCGRHT